MNLSKHNIISKVVGTNQYFIANPLSGHADLLSKAEVSALQNSEDWIQQEAITKGYVVDGQAEEKLYKRKYLDFLDNRANDEVQLFFTPWYTCNFDCSYCFQDEYTNPNEKIKPEVVDAFFNYVDTHFAGRKKYITLFGGEPLLDTPSRRAVIQQVVDGARARGLDLSMVTNGYHLTSYEEVLASAPMREVQVTLDGPKHIHDQRRMLKGGKGSFDKIVAGIDMLLRHHITVNLRMVIDKENIHALPEMALLAKKKGWTTSPSFQTAPGRNYELHHCQTSQNRLFSRIEMYREIYKIVKAHPEVLEFHKPAFSISKFIFENGELPDPLFDSCPGAKTEWAFDYTGKIYACTATVGSQGDELGTYYPKVTLQEDRVEEWEERDVLSIEACTTCAVRLACGGGCAAIAHNRNGKIQAPDCRPVKELMELGVGLYAETEI